MKNKSIKNDIFGEIHQIKYLSTEIYNVMQVRISFGSLYFTYTDKIRENIKFKLSVDGKRVVQFFVHLFTFLILFNFNSEQGGVNDIKYFEVYFIACSF